MCNRVRKQLIVQLCEGYCRLSCQPKAVMWGMCTEIDKGSSRKKKTENLVFKISKLY